MPHRPIGIGCMRLSTERDRDESRAIELLHAALDQGVTFLDTADAYCWDDAETGHNERLIAEALQSWTGNRSQIIVATKGGLTRPNGEWVPDGRARHLREACEASLQALRTERIDLYQLHALDSRTPLSTSVRALASLKEERLIARVGLCNVTVGQIEEASRITEISAVQVELSVLQDVNVLNGVVAYCITHGIQLIAYRPLGGSRRLRQLRHYQALTELASRHAATPAEVALAWLDDLSDQIVSVPGPTKVETVRSIVRAHAITLTDEDRARLDAQFPAGSMVRSAGIRGGSEDSPVSDAIGSGGSSRPPRSGEVVLIMGLPGAGKSTAARAFVEQGYARLNRDDAGGSLRGLLPELERVVDEGSSRIVLDNTYMSRASRARVVQAAAKLGLPVRCVWLATSVEDAQVNAVWRIVSNYGHLLGPEEMKKAVKRDISAFAPSVQFRHQRELEPPDPAEGFSRIEVVPFQRTHDPAMTNKAVIVWCDQTLIDRAGAAHASSLRRYQDDGWLLLGLAWRPEIAEAGRDGPALRDGLEKVEADFARMQEQLGVSIEILYCPHAAGPPKCWCRKPLPGLGVVFIQRHRLDPSKCIYLGAGPQDPGFARRLGFQYREFMPPN